MNYSHINTLKELQAAKAQLRAEIEVTKHELFRSASTTQSQARGAIMKGVVIPAGLLGLGLTGARFMRSSLQNQVEKGINTLESTQDIDNEFTDRWYIRLLPMALQLFQKFLKNKEEDSYYTSDEASEDDYPAAPAQYTAPAGNR